MVQQKIPMAEPLVEVRRGGITESRHRGHLAAVEPDGNLVASLGAPHNVTFLRSSAKPFQALPLLVIGAADRFGFTDEEVALACASHNGEPIHTKVVALMLEKIGLGPESLHCGVHEPYGLEAAAVLRANNELPNVLHNNCSGKHVGMLAVALHLGAPIENYENAENAVQIAIAQVVSQFTDVPVEDFAVGADGCGAPIFGISMRAMALPYARLVSPPSSFDKPTRDACERVVARWPFLTRGSFRRHRASINPPATRVNESFA